MVGMWINHGLVYMQRHPDHIHTFAGMCPVSPANIQSNQAFPAIPAIYLYLRYRYYFTQSPNVFILHRQSTVRVIRNNFTPRKKHMDRALFFFTV